MRRYFEQLKETIEKTDQQKIGVLIEELSKLRYWGRLFVLGVGGSAGNASHAASDFRKLCGLEAYCPTDNVSELTARINDEGWENSLVGCLKASNLNSKDAIMVFSVGGGNQEKNISVNLIRALGYAKKVGAKIFGIVGRDGGYTYKMADVCVLIPTIDSALITPFVESMQVIIWHAMVFHPDLQLKKGKWESL